MKKEVKQTRCKKEVGLNYTREFVLPQNGVTWGIQSYVNYILQVCVSCTVHICFNYDFEGCAKNDIQVCVNGVLQAYVVVGTSGLC